MFGRGVSYGSHGHALSLFAFIFLEISLFKYWYKSMCRLPSATLSEYEQVLVLERGGVPTEFRKKEKERNIGSTQRIELRL